MKFEFKEGQWFDARKLTDWQKQWCLENLKWISEEAKVYINSKDLNIKYFDSYPLLKGMGGMSDDFCNTEDEITFNDFYWGGELSPPEGYNLEYNKTIEWKTYFPYEFKEGSFDNLVYIEPKHVDCNTYYVVEKDKLSESQWEFLLGNVPLAHEPEDNEIYLNLDPDDRKWFGDTYKSEKQDIYVSFNDLFHEVKQY